LTEGRLHNTVALVPLRGPMEINLSPEEIAALTHQAGRRGLTLKSYAKILLSRHLFKADDLRLIDGLYQGETEIFSRLEHRAFLGRRVVPLYAKRVRANGDQIRHLRNGLFLGPDLNIRQAIDHGRDAVRSSVPSAPPQSSKNSWTTMLRHLSLWSYGPKHRSEMQNGDAVRAIVLDVSVIVGWCFEDMVTPYSEAVLSHLQCGGLAVVPATWEWSALLTNLMVENRLPLERYRAFSKALGGLPYVHDVSEDDAIIEWHRANLRVPDFHLYDFAYLELARRRAIPLATVQPNLRAVAKQLGIPVFLEEVGEWQKA
jgi:hypothetical protein